MTSLAVELSVDSRGPCALYIVTDSRITWSASVACWDAGQKAFASNSSADIFGILWRRFFPPYALRQVIDLIDAGVLFSATDRAEERHSKVVSVFKSAMQNGQDMCVSDFSIVHGSRDFEFMQSQFRLWVTHYSSNTPTWHEELIDLDTAKSYLVHVDGSGKKTIEQFKKNWDGTLDEGTSRAALWAFCDALYSKEDGNSGGPPQLVGIWRKGTGHHFGFIWCGKRYVCGVQIPDDSQFDSVKWFNQRFERMDGEKIRLLHDAKKQPKPQKTPR